MKNPKNTASITILFFTSGIIFWLFLPASSLRIFLTIATYFVGFFFLYITLKSVIQKEESFFLKIFQITNWGTLFFILSTFIFVIVVLSSFFNSKSQNRNLYKIEKRMIEMNIRKF